MEAKCLDVDADILRASLQRKEYPGVEAKSGAVCLRYVCLRYFLCSSSREGRSPSRKVFNMPLLRVCMGLRHDVQVEQFLDVFLRTGKANCVAFALHRPKKLQ